MQGTESGFCLAFPSALGELQPNEVSQCSDDMIGKERADSAEAGKVPLPGPVLGNTFGVRMVLEANGHLPSLASPSPSSHLIGT